MASPESDGLKPPKTAKTPAFVPVNQLPPRINAPGILWFGWPPLSPGPPKQLTSPPARPVWLVQSVQLCLISAQSATHSSTLPTMSNAPHFETQAERAPVLAGFGELVTHVVAPSSAFPGSGVPAAASCHSRFVRSRFAESAHACAAWNQSMHVLGSTPGMDTAYTPGEGGAEPTTGVHCPPCGKFVGYAVALNGANGQPSWTAPPASRSASVTVPCCTFAMSAVFVTAICHTLASYLSTQVSPTRTASGGHDRTGLLTLAASAPTFAASVLTDASTAPTRVGSVPRSAPTSTGVSFFLQAVSRRKISPDFFRHNTPAPAAGATPESTHARASPAITVVLVIDRPPPGETSQDAELSCRRRSASTPETTAASMAFCARCRARDRHCAASSGQGRNRTNDTVIFSHVLYQLSYLPRAGRFTGFPPHRQKRRAAPTARLDRAPGAGESCPDEGRCPWVPGPTSRRSVRSATGRGPGPIPTATRRCRTPARSATATVAGVHRPRRQRAPATRSRSPGCSPRCPRSPARSARSSTRSSTGAGTAGSTAASGVFAPQRGERSPVKIVDNAERFGVVRGVPVGTRCDCRHCQRPGGLGCRRRPHPDSRRRRGGLCGPRLRGGDDARDRHPRRGRETHAFLLLPHQGKRLRCRAHARGHRPRADSHPLPRGARSRRPRGRDRRDHALRGRQPPGAEAPRARDHGRGAPSRRHCRPPLAAAVCCRQRGGRAQRRRGRLPPE